MIDTSGIDVYAAFAQYVLLSSKPDAKTHYGEFWTACPFCGVGEDRFKVWPFRPREDGPQYWCRICRKSGDIISLVEQLEGIPCRQACIKLGLVQGTISATASPRRPYNPNDDIAPPEQWQDKAAAFALECKAALWSDAGKNALAWLKKRGLTEVTIKRAGLGYNAVTRFDEKADWGISYAEGKKVWVPRGITIPWHIDRQLWKLNIRRPDVDVKQDVEEGRNPNKYIPVKGGSSGLYGIDSFNPELPTVLAEGEFDRLILHQAEPDVNVLATGSTSKGQGERWALTLAQSPVTLIGFDVDEGGQGEKAAKDYWLKAIPDAMLWQPWAHDINDMYVQGKDVLEWLWMGIDIASELPASPLPAISAQLDTSVPIVDLSKEEASVGFVTDPPAPPAPVEMRLEDPPLICHKCRETRADKFVVHPLRGRWQCRSCGQFGRPVFLAPVPVDAIAS